MPRFGPMTEVEKNKPGIRETIGDYLYAARLLPLLGSAIAINVLCTYEFYQRNSPLYSLSLSATVCGAAVLSGFAYLNFRRTIRQLRR